MGSRMRGATPVAGYSRHLRWENFQLRINDGPPSLEPIKGQPRVDLFIEPGGVRIGVRFFTKKTNDISSPLAEVSIRQVGIGSETALELSTGKRELYRDFYSICCSIADRVQIDKQPIADALSTTLRSFSALLRKKPLLSEEVQVGLLGELLFLKRIADSLGWVAAASSWFGPGSEEHDFVLPTVDIEVKTTRSEKRIHKISSLTQLLPKSNRKLFLISAQVTSAGMGKDSFSLPQLVALVLSEASAVAARAANMIREQLELQRWDDHDADAYNSRFHLRAPLLAAGVDDNFPAIVPATLSSLGPARIARLESVGYSIDIDGLGIPDGSPKFEKILFHPRVTK